MVDGRLVEWLVEPGQRVRRGDVVAVVDTSKGAIEIEVFEDGVVEELVVTEGARVPVGEPLARIRGTTAKQTGTGPEGAVSTGAEVTRAGSPKTERPAMDTDGAKAVEEGLERVQAGRGTAGPAERVSATPAARRRAGELEIDLTTVTPRDPGGVVVLADVERSSGETAPRGDEPSPRTPRSAPPEAREGAAHLHRVSPIARRVAEDLGVDLQDVVGTGPDGAITRRDVERAAGRDARRVAGPVPPPGGEAPEGGGGATAVGETPTEGVSEMRRAIGTAMSRSKREIPHYYLATSIDLGRALSWVDDRNAELPPARRVLPAALLLKAVAVALREVPELNGFWIDDDFRPAPGIHPGVAISLRGGGLVSPAIHGADGLTLDDLSAAIRDLVQRARSGALRSSEVADPTITVTALGERGVETVFGIINPPQVAIVGFGKIVERPWAEEGLVGVRPIVHATLAADHRVTDGHRGGLFLAAVEQLLREPDEL